MAPLTPSHSRKKVAIIGSGCAGIGALWALNRTHHDVYLYEAADRLGGHTNTVEFKNGKSKTMVDTGFIVLNTATYPNFIAFLKYIGVPTVPTEMTFGVSRDQGLFEWAGTSLSAVFAQRKNLFSPRMWRMIFDIIRFNQYALDLLRDEEESKDFVNGNGVHNAGKQESIGDFLTNEGYHFNQFASELLETDAKGQETVNGNGSHRAKKQESIGDYLAREGYSDAFRDDYLIPMTAAVWSTSPDKASLEFPAVTLVRFMWNHHLLSTVSARPQWLTLKDCGKSYIDTVMKGFPPNHIFLNTAVTRITNTPSGRVLLHLSNGQSSTYDHVILATHAPQSLSLLHPSATPTESSILSGFTTSQNTAILHSDLSLMPKLPSAWSSWNYITTSSPTNANIDQVCLTYNMNILQHIPVSTFGHVLVTLNPLHNPPPDLVQGRYTYSHPLYNAQAIKNQALLHKIQNTRGISYAGAWTKYGFHEDGFSSGLKVAREHLGARLPFEFRDSTFSRGQRPVLGLLDLALRVWIAMVQVLVVVVERVFGVQRGVVAKRKVKKTQ